MIIEKKPEILDYISKISDINDLNLSLSDMFLDIINNDEIASKKEIEVLAKTYNLSEKEVLLSKIIEYWGIDADEEDNDEIIKQFIDPAIKEADIKEFINNPYYKTIKVEKVKEGNMSLVLDHYRPYEIFAYDDIKVSKDYHEISSLAFFKEEFPFIALNEKKVTWMSITPNEIKTMEKAIKEANGNVIVFGLGLGYFPFMISLKESVKSITIIEKDEKIISLFEKNLLPQFPYKEKIIIQKKDAFEVIKSTLNYNYAFVDLWHTAEDGIETYLTFKRNEDNSPYITFSYWLETSFYALLRRAFISLILEQLDSYKEKHYQQAETVFDKLVNHYYYQTKNLRVSSVKQLEDLLSDTTLLDLAL
ncbi:MAG: hypothetical protein K5925_06085 [Bacilli bacterium]|nr:hypothetical protein [Bacilli bacterium]